MKNSRRGFIIKTGVAVIGYFALPSILSSDRAIKYTVRNISGRLYDLFGYPVSGVLVQLIRNYSLTIEYTNIYGLVPIESKLTNADGSFFFEFDTNDNKPYTDIGIQFRINGFIQQINSFELTNTNIPFPVLEIYSVIKSKWLDYMLPINISANFFIDPSRKLIQDYFEKNNPRLITQMTKNFGGDSNNISYYGNHHNPEDPEDCLGEWDEDQFDLNECNVHWHYPEIINKNRKIVIPWGKTGRKAIPFVVCEGQLYFVDAQTKDDYDRTFRMIANPAYKHITNPTNPLEYCYPGQVDGEMCIWFMGKKTSNSFTPSFTNIQRDFDTDSLASLFNITTNDICRAYVYDKNAVYDNRYIPPRYVRDTCSRMPVRKERDCKTTRTWMLGTWCADTSHGHGVDHFNEIHPVYWIVPFFGAWERFHLFQYYILNNTVLNAEYFIEQYYKQADLLPHLQQFVKQFIILDKKNYARFVAHLHQYGLNLATDDEEKAGAGFGSSIDISAIDFWAQHQSNDVLIKTLNFKLNKVAALLTNLGNGYLLYPAMFYCYEMVELKKIRIKFNLEAGVTNEVKKYVNEALLKMNSYERLLSLKLPMQTYYEYCLEGLYSKIPDNTKAIADFYAQSALRYIGQGLLLNSQNDNSINDADNSLKYEDHYSFALEKLNAGLIQPLVVLMNKRINEFWKDAIPFARPI